MSHPNYKDNLCPLPWVELSANADTTLRVCCNTYHGGLVKDDEDKSTSITSDESLVEIYNKKTHREIRQAMIRGERPEFCNSCYDRENYGGYSTRQSYYSQFQHLVNDLVGKTNPDGSIDVKNIKLRRIDLALSNLCNLKCRMCSPSCSSSLKTEFDDLGLGYYKEEHLAASTQWRMNPGFKMIYEHHCEHLQEILTTGGEPFISKEHRDILRILKSKNIHSNIKLSYHTSLTILPDELIELWKGFKSVHINLSLEGVREVNDYARYPSRWNDIVRNLKILMDLRDQINLKLVVHSCIQALTWPQHYQLFFFTKFLNSYDRSISCIPNPIWLENPFELSVLNLPIELREAGIRRIKRAMSHTIRTLKRPLTTTELNYYSSYEAAFNKLKDYPYEPEKFELFKKRITAVDKYRQQNVTDVVPDFKPYF